MRAYYFIGLLLCLFICQGNAQKRDYSDGPYLQIINDSIICNWVEHGQLKEKLYDRDSTINIENSMVPDLAFHANQSLYNDNATRYVSENQTIAISDIHGQYSLFVELLTNHDIIDQKLNWSFGAGNLVIVGDVMGRGDKVTECLWLIYNLELQAKENGGKVHFILGNHELMVMNGNLDYLNKKYRYTSALMQTPYNLLLGPNTILGQWLSSKNVILQINDKLFVHGGLSQQAMSLGLDIEEINNLFKEKIYYKSQKDIEATEELSTLYFENGPLWYRGYAYPYSFKKNGIDSLLTTLDIQHIIVGHTTLSNIKGLYGNKIILIDSGIKKGVTGEILVIDSTDFSVGMLDGTSTLLVSEEQKEKNRRSLYEFLYEKEDVSLQISASNKEIQKNYRKKEKETEGEMSFIVDGEQYIFSAQFSPGGKSRRKLCSNPPIKFNLKKKELSNFNFIPQNDRLKVVLQCKDSDKLAQTIRLEKFVYDLYNIVTPYSHLSKLVRFKSFGDEKSLVGYLLENRNDLELRLNLKEIKTSTIDTKLLDKIEYAKMCLFQYMIANTDWSARKMHNSKFYQKQDDKAFVSVPYDFDQAGLINNHYATPSEKLSISTVTQRHFMDKKISMEDLESAVAYFLSIEQDVINLCDEVDYLNESSKKQANEFVTEFYANIKKPKYLKSMLKR